MYSTTQKTFSPALPKRINLMIIYIRLRDLLRLRSHVSSGTVPDKIQNII